MDRLQATFGIIFQHIFRSFKFGSEVDPQNIGLLGVVECELVHGLALRNLWESRLNFMRQHWRGRNRVGGVN